MKKINKDKFKESLFKSGVGDSNDWDIDKLYNYPDDLDKMINAIKNK